MAGKVVKLLMQKLGKWIFLLMDESMDGYWMEIWIN